LGAARRLAKPIAGDSLFWWFESVHFLRGKLLLKPFDQGNSAVASMLGLMCDGGYAEYCTVDETAFVQVGAIFEPLSCDP
jgi:hypothetical protein